MAKRSPVTVEPPANEKEFNALVDLGSQSFNTSREPAKSEERWLNHVGRENLRVAKRSKHVLGGLGILYFRQWFGGGSIASAGITSVAVSPEARGTGVGTHLMRTVVAELHAQGVPLSSLYPATYTVYRAAGYEPAGEQLTWELDLHRLGMQDRACSVRPLADADRQPVYDLHREYGRRQAGVVDRTPREWASIFELATDPLYAYVIEAPGRRTGLEGYVIFVQQDFPGAPYDIHVRDHAFLTPAAGRRLLTFLADHGTVARRAILLGPHNDPLPALARFEIRKPRSSHFWMLRVIDAAQVLRERGYPPGVKCELHLEISDDLLPQNSGRFALSISNSTGRVRTGGRGRIKLDIRGLAPLFSGHLSATQLASIGMLDASVDDLALASTVFAGPPPWMNDHF
jgi:predicted acetyltransferase